MHTANYFFLKPQHRSWSLLSKPLKQAFSVSCGSILVYIVSIHVSTLLNRNEFKYSAELGYHLSANSPVQFSKFTKLHVERITPDLCSMLQENDPWRNTEPSKEVCHIIKSMTYTFAPRHPDYIKKAVKQSSECYHEHKSPSDYQASQSRVQMVYSGLLMNTSKANMDLKGNMDYFPHHSMLGYTTNSSISET